MRSPMCALGPLRIPVRVARHMTLKQKQGEKIRTTHNTTRDLSLGGDYTAKPPVKCGSGNLDNQPDVAPCKLQRPVLLRTSHLSGVHSSGGQVSHASSSRGPKGRDCAEGKPSHGSAVRSKCSQSHWDQNYKVMPAYVNFNQLLVVSASHVLAHALPTDCVFSDSDSDLQWIKILQF